MTLRVQRLRQTILQCCELALDSFGLLAAARDERPLLPVLSAHADLMLILALKNAVNLTSRCRAGINKRLERRDRLREGRRPAA